MLIAPKPSEDGETNWIRRGVLFLSRSGVCSENVVIIESFHLSVSSRGIQQQLSSYRETVIRQATVSSGSASHRDDAPTCGICHKTKFADGCGNLCSYCQTKFCARCGGRVSLRSNTVSRDGSPALYVVICRRCVRSFSHILTSSFKKDAVNIPMERIQYCNTVYPVKRGSDVWTQVEVMSHGVSFLSCACCSWDQGVLPLM